MKQPLNIELKKLKFGLHSQETIDFVAEVYVNGKHIATAENQGYGGPTSTYKEKNISYEEYQSILNYFKNLPVDPKYPSLSMDFEMVIDTLVDKAFNDRQRKKDENKCILIGIPGDSMYKMLGWKGTTVKKLMSNEKSIDWLEKQIPLLLSKVMPGEKILNTNLGRLQNLIK